MDKNEIASCSLNTETNVLVNKRLSVRRHGNKLAGSDECVELKVYNNCVQTVKSSPTCFDLTKYSTSLNFLSVLSVYIAKYCLSCVASDLKSPGHRKKAYAFF